MLVFHHFYAKTGAFLTPFCGFNLESGLPVVKSPDGQPTTDNRLTVSLAATAGPPARHRSHLPTE